MINSLQPWTPAPHRTPALPAGHRDGVAGGARGCGENTRTPAHVCLPEGHRDGVRHSAGRPQLLGLRLTRLACGKLGVYCLPEWPAMAGGVPEGPGTLARGRWASVNRCKEHIVSYLEDQRQKAVQIRDALFRDPGSGLFNGKARNFVLKDQSLNLWDGIREDAKQYFRQCRIPWWKGSADDPTGHLLSSQVASLNHLYYVRQRKDIATALLKRANPDIVEALVVDDGFVEFEYIGKKQYLKEKAFTRGANCTSLDAVMLGVTSEAKRIMFLIEWKYTEMYKREDLYVPERAAVYDSLIARSDGPFVVGADPKSFYYEPFYQMMRQTLLGWLFAKNREMNCDSCVNVHVIPSDNLELKRNMTSPTFRGQHIHEAWKNTLKVPDSYVPIDPASLLRDAAHLVDTKSWLSYLRARYW